MVRKVDENDEFIYSVTQEHNHLVDACDVAVAQTKSKLKRLADSSRESTRAVASAIEGQPPQVLASLPQYSSMANIVRKIRKGTTQTAPKNLLELEFTGDWCKYGDCGENVVWYDSWSKNENEEFDDEEDDDDNNERRIVIITTESNLDFLETCETIQMDGTFDTCPHLFSQLYVIHGESSYHIYKCSQSSTATACFYSNKCRVVQYNQIDSYDKNSEGVELDESNSPIYSTDVRTIRMAYK